MREEKEESTPKGAAHRIKVGFGRLALVIGAVVAMAGAVIGFNLAGPPIPEGINDRAELQRELDKIQANTELPPECEKQEDETARERLNRLIECPYTEEAPTARARFLKDQLNVIDSYRAKYPGAWYQYPLWLRTVLTTLVGAFVGFAVVYSGIWLLGWVIAGFF